MLISLAASASSSFGGVAASPTWLAFDALLVAGAKAALSWVPHVRSPYGLENEELVGPLLCCSLIWGIHAQPDLLQLSSTLIPGVGVGAGAGHNL